MSASFDNPAVVTGLENISFHSNSKRREMPKNDQTTMQLCLFHTLQQGKPKNPGKIKLTPKFGTTGSLGKNTKQSPSL